MKRKVLQEQIMVLHWPNTKTSLDVAKDWDIVDFSPISRSEIMLHLRRFVEWKDTQKENNSK